MICPRRSLTERCRFPVPVRKYRPGWPGGIRRLVHPYGRVRFFPLVRKESEERHAKGKGFAQSRRFPLESHPPKSAGRVRPTVFRCAFPASGRAAPCFPGGIRRLVRPSGGRFFPHERKESAPGGMDKPANPTRVTRAACRPGTKKRNPSKGRGGRIISALRGQAEFHSVSHIGWGRGYGGTVKTVPYGAANRRIGNIAAGRRTPRAARRPGGFLRCRRCRA
jgi:hypothetical protein